MGPPCWRNPSSRRSPLRLRRRLQVHLACHLCRQVKKWVSGVKSDGSTTLTPLRLPLQPQRLYHLLIHLGWLPVFLPHHPKPASVVPHRPPNSIRLQRGSHVAYPIHPRSEEHTSELQSLRHLV